MGTPLTTDDIKTLDQLVAAGAISGANRLAIEQTLGAEFVTATFTQILAYIQANISSGGVTVSTETGDKAIADGADDLLIYLSGASADSTFTAPVAANNVNRKLTFINKESLYSLTADVTGGGTIDGIASIKMSEQYNEITIFSDGSAWTVLSTKGFVLAPHNDVLIPVYSKSFSGTAPSTFNSWVNNWKAHGVAGGESNILSLVMAIHSSVDSVMFGGGGQANNVARWAIRYNDTYIEPFLNNVAYQNQPYTMSVYYKY